MSPSRDPVTGRELVEIIRSHKRRIEAASAPVKTVESVHFNTRCLYPTPGIHVDTEQTGSCPVCRTSYQLTSIPGLFHWFAWDVSWYECTLSIGVVVVDNPRQSYIIYIYTKIHLGQDFSSTRRQLGFQLGKTPTWQGSSSARLQLGKTPTWQGSRPAMIGAVALCSTYNRLTKGQKLRSPAVKKSKYTWRPTVGQGWVSCAVV